jgi:hypothetical protein
MRRKGLSRNKFHWFLYIGITFALAAWFIIKGYFSNCVFEWPTKFYSLSCLKEQIEPAQKKALEETVDLMPSFK